MSTTHKLLRVHHTLRHHHHHSLSSLRHHATLTSPSPSPSPSLSPPPPNLMPYDCLAEVVKSKLRRFDQPDPRFLRHGSPHPSPSATPSHLLSLPATAVTTLPNGLRVASQPNLAVSSAVVSVWVSAGSRFDPDDKPGLAHFAKRAVLGRECPAAADLGSELDGWASREDSGFSARVLRKDVARGVEVLGGVLQDLDFKQELIDKVRQGIIQEKEQMGAGDYQAILEHLHATAFQYTPLGRPIIGSVDSIKSISKEDIQEYISSHYAAHRMVISASGAVKHEDVVEQVKKVFTKLSANPTTTSQLVANEPTSFTGSEVRIIDDDLPLAQFAVAFEGASETDADFIALSVMEHMLGSWSKYDGTGKHVGSQLVQRAAINEIAEVMKTFNLSYKDTGLFGVYALAKPDCLDDLSYAIMHEISKLSYRVAEDDVIRARNQLKTSFLLRTNEFGAIAEDIGEQLLAYGRRIPLAELFARIDAVDASAIKRVANRFFFDRDVAIAAMGPIKGLPDYNWFRRRTYWLRY